MTAGSSVSFERLESLYCVPADHGHPGAVRDRLDGIAADEFAPAWRRAAAGLVPEHDPSVWIVRTVEVEVEVDLAASDDVAAGEWAARAAVALSATLERGDGRDVARFADRSDQLARFLHDLAAGRAWGSWVHAPFEALSTLPAATAAVEALSREPEHAAAALARLDAAGQLEPVLALLGGGGVRRVLALLRGAAGDGAGARELAGVGGDAATEVARRARSGAAAVGAVDSAPEVGLEDTALERGAAGTVRGEPGVADGSRSESAAGEAAAALDPAIADGGTAAPAAVVAAALRAAGLPDAQAALLADVLGIDHGLTHPSLLGTLLLECADACAAFASRPGRETARAVARALRAAQGGAVPADAHFRRRAVERLLGRAVAGGGPEAIDELAALVRVAVASAAAGEPVPQPGLAAEAQAVLAALRDAAAGAASPAGSAGAPAGARADRAAVAAAAEWVRSAAAGDGAWLERTLAAVGLRFGDASAAGAASDRDGAVEIDSAAPRRPEPDELVTQHGGVFLLLPVLAELGIADDAVLRTLVLLECIGRPRLRAATGDAAVALAAGLDRPPTPEQLADAAAASQPAGLVPRLAAAGRLDEAAAALELAAGAIVCRDTLGDYWLHVAPADDAAEAAASAIERVRAAGVALETVILRGEAAAALADVRLDARVLREEEAAREPRLAQWLERSRPAAPELAHFTLTPPLPRADALAWAPPAVAVLRGLGARLLGFGWSSAAYLWENALGGTSVVRVGRSAIDVELPLVPLDVVLRLSGVDDRVYTVPWLPDYEIRLHLPSQ